MRSCPDLSQVPQTVQKLKSEDHTARVWNAANGQLVTTLQGHTGSVQSAVFSPDGQRIVTASQDDTARVIRMVTFSEIADLLAK